MAHRKVPQINNFPFLLTPTTVAGIQCSSMSVCGSVCSHDRTKTAETTIIKLATGIVHHEPDYTHLILCQRSMAQGHKVQKHISVEGDCVAGVSFHSIEWPSSIVNVMLQLNLSISLKVLVSMSGILMVPPVSERASTIPPQNIASKTGLAVTRNILWARTRVLLPSCEQNSKQTSVAISFSNT